MFISHNSLKLFSRFRINTDFLNQDPITWNTNVSYLNGKEVIKSLKVINDIAERAVKLIQDYNGRVVRDAEQQEFLLRCVQEHRRLYPNCNKNTLKEPY